MRDAENPLDVILHGWRGPKDRCVSLPQLRLAESLVNSNVDSEVLNAQAAVALKLCFTGFGHQWFGPDVPHELPPARLCR